MNRLLDEQKAIVHTERVKEREVLLSKFLDFERKLEMTLVGFKVGMYVCNIKAGWHEQLGW